MNSFDYFLAIVFFAFSMIFTVVSIHELCKPMASSKYRNLSSGQIVIVKTSSCLLGLSLAAFSAFGGVYFVREARRKKQ